MLSRLERRLERVQYIRAMREKLGPKGEPLRKYEEMMMRLAKRALEEESGSGEQTKSLSIRQ